MFSSMEQKLPIFVELPAINSIALKDLTWTVCIDISGSTTTYFNGATVLKYKCEFAKRIVRCVNNVNYVKWDHGAEEFKYVDFKLLKSSGGTAPACILENETTARLIEQSDAMLIITDGEIDQERVEAFGKKLASQGNHLKAIIGVVVENAEAKPADVNISVLAPIMLTDSCVLHYRENTSVLWSSGSFKTQLCPPDIDDNITWQQLRKIGPIDLMQGNVNCCDSNERQLLISQGYVSFSYNSFFHPQKLLEYSPSWVEIKSYPFDRICSHFKISGEYKKLYQWFILQRNRIMDSIFVNNDDRTNFDILLDRMHNNNNLITSFVKRRNQTIAQQYVASDADIEFLLDDPHAIEVMKFFRNLCRIMKDDVEKKSYKSGSFSSAKFACGSSMSSVSDILENKMTVSFNSPFEWEDKFMKLCKNYNEMKVECSVCCEVAIPFVLIRKMINKKDFKHNVDEKTIDNCDYFYPQFVCAKCATWFCLQKQDPVRVSCLAGLPIINMNKINDIVFENYLESFCKLTNLLYEKKNDAGYSSITYFLASMIGYGLYYVVSTPLKKLSDVVGVTSLYNSITKTSSDPVFKIKVDERQMEVLELIIGFGDNINIKIHDDDALVAKYMTSIENLMLKYIIKYSSTENYGMGSKGIYFLS
jgi:hypothetical protein